MKKGWDLVHPSRVDDLWPVLSPWLIQAINGATLEDLDTIKGDLKRGASQLWVTYEVEQGNVLVVAVTELHVVGRKKTCVIRWLGGRAVEEWVDHIGIIEQWAAHNGFEEIEVWGRPGWKKLLTRFGYKETFRVLSKRVDMRVH